MQILRNSHLNIGEAAHSNCCDGLTDGQDENNTSPPEGQKIIIMQIITGK